MGGLRETHETIRRYLARRDRAAILRYQLRKAQDRLRGYLAGRDRAGILMYHSVSDREDYHWSVAPETFRRQMEHLEAHYEVIGLPELVRRLRSGEPVRGSAALTFDDGYADFATNAFPVLEALGLPASVFVTAGRIGGRDERELAYLSAAEVRRLAASPLIELGPHTVSHPDLTKLSEDEATRELAESKERLESLMERSARSFAYPYGGYNRKVRSLVAQAGFDVAVTTRMRAVTHADDLLVLPRLQIDRSVTDTSFPELLAAYLPTP